MSTNSSTVLVVAENYSTYHRWLQTKDNQEKYLFVGNLATMDEHIDADGILLGNWKNRPDADLIWKWIEKRKQRRMENASFINDLLGGSPNGV